MRRSLDRHELVDMTVNAVPFAILVVFAAVFAVFNPWGGVGLATVLQFGLLLFHAAVLAYVTYRIGLLVTDDPSRGQEARESEAE